MIYFHYIIFPFFIRIKVFFSYALYARADTKVNLKATVLLPGGCQYPVT